MSAQSKKRLKKRTFKKLSPIILVLISVVFLSFFGIYRVVRKSVTSAFSAGSEDLMAQDFFSVLYIPNKLDDVENVEFNDLYLVMVNPHKNIVMSMRIPEDVKIEALGRFGRESISNVFMIGEKYTDEGLGGIGYLVNSMEYELGISIDRYIYTTGSEEEIFTSMFKDQNLGGLSSIKLFLNAKDNMVTNLGVSDFLSLLESLNTSKIEYIEMEEYTNSIRQFVANSNISLENKAVAVLNGAQLPGVAKLGGVVCENAGMRVIEIGNASKIYEESVLIVDDPGSLSAAYLMRFFGFTQVMKKKDLTGFAEPVVDRADITVIIGLDIAEQL